MPRYVLVLDVPITTPRVSDALAGWVDLDEVLAEQGDGGGGITNSAPENTIPVTTDGDGNLGATSDPITWDAFTRTLGFNVGPDEDVNINVVGLGAQLILKAADGDADHVGGELTLVTGSSNGQSGGQLNLTAGNDGGGGDGGNVVIQSGNATDGAAGGGDSGDIDIQVGAGNIADSSGGSINITAGRGITEGGSVVIGAGARTGGAGDHGTVQIYSADAANALDLSNAGLTVIGPVGFYGGAPAAQPQVPASPTEQDIVDALIALGLITQAA